MNDLFSSINRSTRLKEERKRLGLTQVKAAEIIQKLEASWIRYEKHGDPLNQDQIYALQNAGFDMSYVLFGIKTDEGGNTFSEVEQLYTQIDEAHQPEVVAVLKAFAKAYPK
ncbi:hypothetical protein A7P53_15055 [Acinetobacter defluvii]|uniref:helix-turn-helix domain-containing protein n=1 Tax=Acinetobacter defluvii TaxID=1871111 RepID=UPI00148FCB97|nr:helix-turn-helix transcriptional regulator [Acinetobacter defluvii]NNP73902.1 hypothetical protein [Acinetobacter defluvii]